MICKVIGHAAVADDGLCAPPVRHHGNASSCYRISLVGKEKKKIPWWWNEYACLSAINRRRWPTNWHAVPSEDVSVRSLSNHKTCNFSNKKHIHRNEEGTSAFAKEKSHISEDGQISNFEAGLLLKMVTRTLIITNLNQRPAPFCILNASTSIRTQVEKNKSARICAETEVSRNDQ